MTWRDRVWRLLRWPALAAGGMTTAALGANAAAAMGDGLEVPGNSSRGPVLLPNTLNATAEDQYAAHRSHSSHRSHRSHRSSSGGVRSTPTPQPQYQPPPSNRAPSVIPKTTPRIERTIPNPTPQNVSRMVIRVQAALMRRGYYNGDIDGLLGPKTRAALRAFQQTEGIPQTGRMDIKTLTRLGISIP